VNFLGTAGEPGRQDVQPIRLNPQIDYAGNGTVTLNRVINLNLTSVRHKDLERSLRLSNKYGYP